MVFAGHNFGRRNICRMPWNETLKKWAKAPSETEQTKCNNAVTAIRKAINASKKLNSKSITIFAQGSYCNRTNVRLNSDVDVCILCDDTFFYQVPDGKTSADFGLNSPASYRFDEYKNDIETALVQYFGKGGVTRGNKAFDIHENTYRIDADAVAAFEHRRYLEGGAYETGIAFNADKGERVINWPSRTTRMA